MVRSHENTGRRSGRAVALVAVVSLLLAACSGGEEPEGPDVTPSPTAMPTASPTDTGGTPSPDPTSSADADTGPVPDPDAFGTWTSIPAAPMDRADEWMTVGGAWTGDRFLLVGSPGQGDTGQFELWAWAPDAGWEQGATLDPAPSPWLSEVIWADGLLLVLGRAETEAGGSTAPLELHVHNPEADLWWEATTSPLGPRWGHSATWTGEHLVVFGGMEDVPSNDDSYRVATLDDGAAWHLEEDSWFALGPFPHDDRSSHGAVWNGRRLVVFGGGSASGRFPVEGEWPWDGDADGAAAWDPGTNTWTSIDGPGAIGPIVAATWTGDVILWWNGATEGWAYDDADAGGIWETNTGTIDPLPLPPLAPRRDAAHAIWADEIGAWLTWGGVCGEGCNTNLDDGAAFVLEERTWRRLPVVGLGRRLSPLAWTGEELLVVGGAFGDQEAQEFGWRVDGARWRP